MFDPYRKWLGIPEDQRPPTHYQMLGISPDEHDSDVIEAAVVRQSAYVRNFQAGQLGEHAARILTEIAAARHCLLDAGRRAQYDAELKAKQKPPRPVIDDEPRLLDVDAPTRAPSTAPSTAPTTAAPRQPGAPASHSSGHLSGVTPDLGRATPSRSRAASPPVAPPAAARPLPPAVDLEELAPLARPARRSVGQPRMVSGARGRRPAVGRQQNLMGLMWQLPLLVAIAIALVLLAGALGRSIARNRARNAPPPAAQDALIDERGNASPGDTPHTTHSPLPKNHQFVQVRRWRVPNTVASGAALDHLLVAVLFISRRPGVCPTHLTSLARLSEVTTEGADRHGHLRLGGISRDTVGS